MKSIALYSIIDKWADKLLNSEKINQYCLTKYGMLPLIQKGWDQQNSPTDEDCPYIAIHEAHKEEGLGQSEYDYMITVLWAVTNDNYTMEGRLKVYDGAVECDELGQLIVDELQMVNPSFPINTVDYTIANENYFPGFPGQALLSITIPVVMGANITY
jgi:hypothetical protein